MEEEIVQQAQEEDLLLATLNNTLKQNDKNVRILKKYKND